MLYSEIYSKISPQLYFMKSQGFKNFTLIVSLKFWYMEAYNRSIHKQWEFQYSFTPSFRSMLESVFKTIFLKVSTFQLSQANFCSISAPKVEQENLLKSKS